MSMMLIDPKLLAQMNKSTCYGNAHDSTAKECKMCDVQQECAGRTASNNVFDPLKQLSPLTDKAMEEADSKRKKKPEPPIVAEKPAKKEQQPKKEKPAADLQDIPNMKGMSIDELWALLKERNGTCNTFANPNIQKMRLIMAIKDTYKST